MRRPVMSHASQLRPARRWQRINQTIEIIIVAGDTCIQRNIEPYSAGVCACISANSCTAKTAAAMALTEKNRCSNALGLRTQTTSINHAWSIGGLSAQTRAIHSIPQLGFQPRGAGFQGGSRVRVQMPAKHPVRVQVDHYRQMHRALQNPLECDFRHPFPILAWRRDSHACHRAFFSCRRGNLPSSATPSRKGLSPIADACPIVRSLAESALLCVLLVQWQ